MVFDHIEDNVSLQPRSNDSFVIWENLVNPICNTEALNRSQKGSNMVLNGVSFLHIPVLLSKIASVFLTWWLSISKGDPNALCRKFSTSLKFTTNKSKFFTGCCLTPEMSFSFYLKEILSVRA